MTSRSVNGGEGGGEERALFQKVPAAVSLLPNYSYSISSSTAARCYFPYFLFAFFFCFWRKYRERRMRVSNSVARFRNSVDGKLLRRLLGFN